MLWANAGQQGTSKHPALGPHLHRKLRAGEKSSAPCPMVGDDAVVKCLKDLESMNQKLNHGQVGQQQVVAG